MNSYGADISIESLEKIELICREFETSCRQDIKKASISAFLERVDSAVKGPLLLELILLRTDYQLRAGEWPNRESYLREFPEFSETIARAFAKIAASSRRSKTELPELGPRFEVLELLGSGGMGSVYRARDVKLDRDVAIKVLKKISDDLVKRFEREILLTASLTHPNIVRLYDFLEHRGNRFAVLELASGTTLRHHLNHVGKLEQRETVQIAMGIAKALEVAHQRGIIHRDIKPENVMVDVNDNVKVLDFGLARPTQVTTDLKLTREDVNPGTFPYMSPEQIFGGALTCETDIFSLGIVMLEMISGTNPVLGKNIAETTRRLTELRPADVEKLSSSASPKLQSLLTSMLSQAASDRTPAARVTQRLIDLQNDTTADSPTKTSVSNSRKQPLASTALHRERESISSEDESMDSSEGQSRPSIAVLPFENLRDAPEQEYFADGICEDITTALSCIRWLLVIARNSTLSYKGNDVDVRDVGRELDVRYVLEGSVRRHGNRIRISIKLVETETAKQIWAERYDRELTDVFELQDEITEHVVAALEPQVSEAEVRRSLSKSEQNLDAWDLALRAMSHIIKFTNSGSSEGLRLLDEALKVDPKYARALGQKAWITVWRIHQGWDDPEKTLPVAIEASEEAVKSDAEELWAHIGRGFVASVLRDPATLLNALRRAIEINPNSALAYSYTAAVHAVLGEGQLAFEPLAKARRLSPRDILRDQFDVHEALAHFQIYQYNEAADFAGRASHFRPDHVYPRLILASSFGQLEKLAAARDQADRITELVPGFSLKQARTSCVYAYDADIDRFIEGLKKAGLQ